MLDEYNNLVKSLYKDFLEKKNKYKIEKDNLKADIEILKQNLEHAKDIRDESKFFSPRNNDTDFSSEEEIKEELIKKESLLDDYNEKYNYYTDYCKKMKSMINSYKDETEKEKSKNINDIIYGSENDIKENNSQETKEINSDTDYNNEELKRRISNLKHKSENCIKIFEIDRVRAKQEIININKSLDNILNNLLNVSRETFN